MTSLPTIPSQIMRDPDTGNSKGFAFVNYASFDASDAAIEAMHGQHLCNRAITVSYAFKKDSKGERHGSAAGSGPLLRLPRVYLLVPMVGVYGLYADYF